jgi:transposase
MKDFLTAQEISILEEAHHSCRLRKSADRIKTILLLDEGYSYEKIAHILRLDDGTIRRYFKEFKTEGIDGLLEDHYHGSAGFLTSRQERELTLYLKIIFTKQSKRLLPTSVTRTASNTQLRE